MLMIKVDYTKTQSLRELSQCPTAQCPTAEIFKSVLLRSQCPSVKNNSVVFSDEGKVGRPNSCTPHRPLLDKMADRFDTQSTDS